MSAAQLAAHGSPHVRKRAEQEAGGARRPRVWDRVRPAPLLVLRADVAQAELVARTGWDPRRDAAGCVFDAARAESVVAWFHEHLTHVKGSLGGEPFVLTPLQQGILGALYGWRRADGSRRFRSCFLYVPRKWGKTLFAAGLALHAFFEDGEPGAEVYCAAATRDQARLLWTAAKRMAQSDEMLSRYCRIYQHSIVRFDRETLKEDGAWFQAISAEASTAHGFNPHFVVVDELHAQPDGELVDVLETGMSSRAQPLICYITTADYERESVCNEKLDYARKVRDGAVLDPTLLPVIFEATEADDWESESVWARVNPNYPVTPTAEYMREQAARARSVPRFLNTFLRLHLNRRTKTDLTWLDMDRWDTCPRDVDLASLAGRPCFGGLDVSSVSDLTCFVLYFPYDRHVVLPWFWAPRATALRREERHLVPSYMTWAREGHMSLCDGDWIDQREIRRKIQSLAEVYAIEEIAVDRFDTSKIMIELRDEDGLSILQFGQGFVSMSAPSKELERMVLAQDLRHLGHPVLRWCASNAMAAVDSRSTAENIKPVKAVGKTKARKQDDNKIDGVVALVMAIGASMSHPSEPSSLDAAYEDGDLYA